MAYTTIKKPTDYFNTVLYEGNGATGRGITGVGHQPDFVWIKNRDATTPHVLTDAVRGATVTLNSNDTSADDTISNGLTAFGTDGFTIGGNGSFNYSNESFVSWNWKANGAGSANTDGSISSTVSANTTSGFSIVAWNGNSGTVGHGLGVKPDFIVIKSRQTAGSNNWVVAHSALGTNMNDNYIVLNSNGAAGSGSNTWGGEPTTTTFTVSSSVAANDNNIAYCFAGKTGYSKFGSYVGNGSTFDNTFVYTGFKPAFIIIKRKDGGGGTAQWLMMDSKRIGYNQSNYRLYPNLTNSEITTDYIDFLSNGFKIRDSGNDFGASGGSYIYMAFAEEPLVGDNPATAR